MAHITKFKASAMGQIFAHINRDRDTISKYGNADIDVSKTSQNLVFVQGDLGTLQKRLDEVAHSARSDLVVCCGVAITLPNELKNAKIEEQKDFFTECHNFLVSKFGEKNAVYSVVHFDETSPHLHFGFVPVVEKQIKYRSKEKAGQTYTQERVCADDVVTRKMLNTFHDELQAHISKAFPNVRIVAEDKQKRMKQSKSLQELKEETKKRMESKEKQLDQVCWEAKIWKHVAESLKDEAQAVKDKAEQTAKQEAKEKAQEDVEKIKQDAFLEAQNAVESLRRLSEKLSKTKNAKKASILGKVILSADEYADLYSKASIDTELKEAKETLNALSGKHLQDLEKANKDLNSQNKALKIENESLKEQNKKAQSDIAEAKEQSEKDKSTINNLKIQNNSYSERIDTLSAENKTLKKENETLKEYLFEVWDHLSSYAVKALEAVGIKKSKKIYRGR